MAGASSRSRASPAAAFKGSSDSGRTASIGPITSQTMQELGLRVDLEAEQHDIPGLVDAIVRFYAGKPRS